VRGSAWWKQRVWRTLEMQLSTPVHCNHRAQQQQQQQQLQSAALPKRLSQVWGRVRQIGRQRCPQQQLKQRQQQQLQSRRCWQEEGRRLSLVRGTRVREMGARVRGRRWRWQLRCQISSLQQQQLQSLQQQHQRLQGPWGQRQEGQEVARSKAALRRQQLLPHQLTAAMARVGCQQQLLSMQSLL